jgi:NAD(P)-dependent dehydrogenase (short-subunit alcohol dehydrogenase family)
MMDAFLQGGIAVITGAASGFGLEASRIAARLGMNVVMADVQPDALELAAREIEGLGAQVLRVQPDDVSEGRRRRGAGAATMQRFGAPHFVFNNAGVGRCRRPDLGAQPARLGVGASAST